MRKLLVTVRQQYKAILIVVKAPIL